MASEAQKKVEDAEWDVIVVGAGLAGLSSAYRFNNRCPKAKILILEANDRIGGRTLSTEVSVQTTSSSSGVSDVLDLGAHWICTTQYEIMEMAHEFGIKYFRQNVDGKKIMMVGNNRMRTYNSEIPSVGSYWNLNTWVGIIQMHFGLNKIEAIAKTIDVRNPYLHPMAHVYDSQTAASFFRNLVSYEEVYDIMNAAFIAAFGCDLSQISFLFFLVLGKAGGGVMNLFVVENFGAEEFRVIGGTQQFSEILAKKVRETDRSSSQNNILLGHPVKHIIQHDNTRGTIEVICDNGKHFTGSYVVLAAPPNMIARMEMQPPLPIRQQRLYESMKMGNLAKVFVIYQKPFWLSNGYSGEYVGKATLATSSHEGKGPISIMYDATTVNGLPALVGFIGGEALDKWWNEDVEIFEKSVINQMISCFGDEAKQPEQIIFKNWFNEPNIRGGPINILEPGNMRYFHYLRKPHINIHFAGTNFASKWMGYMSGAVQSGYTAAAEILEKLEPHLLNDDDKKYLDTENSFSSHENLAQNNGFSRINFANGVLLPAIGIGIFIGMYRSKL